MKKLVAWNAVIHRLGSVQYGMVVFTSSVCVFSFNLHFSLANHFQLLSGKIPTISRVWIYTCKDINVKVT